jgi:5-methylcytosine-specific restriction protein A
VTTFLLTWNPDRTEVDEAERVEATASGTDWIGSWSVGARKQGIAPDDYALLVRQHRDRGIVASGYFTTDIEEGPHWDGVPGHVARYAEVAFDTWLPAEERLPIETLQRDIPEVAWDRLQGSGVEVNKTVADHLDALWSKHLDSVGRGPLIPEEIRLDESGPEFGATGIMVNNYERVILARRACIDRWGYRCSVCGFDFEERYGDLGKDYIAVHHLIDLSTLDEDYKLDPINDLRPVCSNCHAMLHRGGHPAMAIEDLRARLRVI